MQPIQAPVNAKSTKKAIANLQAALQFLGLQMNADEIKNKLYGDTTRRAVIGIQQQFRLKEEDGYVGVTTAQQLNTMLKDKGAFDEKETRLEGQITERSTGAAINNLTVESWGKGATTGDTLLTKVATNGDGIFSTSFKESQLKQTPDVYFRIFQGNDLLADTRSSTVWHSKDGKNQITIPVDRLVSIQGKISGVVTTSEGVALKRKIVNAFRKTIDEAIPIGSSITDEKGAYIINYKASVLPNTKPDLQTKAFDLTADTSSNTAKELGHSEVKYNAGENEILNIVVPVDNLDKITEYDRLTREVQNHLGTLSWTDLQEGDGKEHITYLSNKSGWDPRMIAMTAQANKLSAQNNIPASHYYAFFRAGLTSDTAINKLSPQHVETILNKAAEQQLIPNDNHIQETVKTLRTQSVNYLLSNSFVAGISNLNTMLALHLNDTQKQTFVATVQEAAGDNTVLWSSLKQKGFDDATIKRLQLDGKMGFLTLQNAPLIKRLYDAHGISDPVELVHNGYYKPQQWLQMIGNDVPKDVKPDNYAQHLSKQLIISYPTAVAAEMLNRDEIKMPNDFSKEEVYNFFSANQQKFDLGKKPLKHWDGFDNLSDDSKNAVKTLERLYQLTPSNEAMTTLANLGLTSAFQITKFTKQEFLLKHGQSFNNPEEAELTYNKASEVSSGVMNLATSYLTTRSMPNVYGITGKTKKEQNAIIAYPTLEELFGNMDYCACDDCKSVLGPAAYLVDLLQFIDLADVPHDLQNPIDVLFNRRPDIQHIQLTCENTNTALPYIDLVNEILEYYVVNGNLTAFKQHDITEDIKTVDLLANPQFVMDAAYTEVKTKVYPYNLPFDYPLEALRLLFNAWDESLADALQTFGSAVQTRKEVLGLNKEEYQILTDINFHQLPEYFGEAANLPFSLLNLNIANGKAFSQRTNIQYDELVQLLKTVFINPGSVLVPLLEKLGLSLTTLQSYYDSAITDAQLDAMLPAGIDQTPYNGNIKQWLKDNQSLIMGMILLTDTSSESTECNFADVQLRFALPDFIKNTLNPLAYQKLHRFIRLWKKLGWSIEVTDEVVTTFLPMPSQQIDESNIDSVFTTLLARIANFKRIMQQLNASEKKVADFILLWDTTQTADFRQLQAAKLLKMRVEDLQDLSTITGLNPLANDLETDNPALLQFVIIVQQLKKISLKVADLNYILRHKDESGKLTPTEESLLKNIKTLRDALTAIEKEHSIAPDNADFAFAKTKMALVYDAAVVNEFFGLLTNEKTYTTPFITTEEGLPAPVTNKDANLGFDPFKKELTYRGILSAAGKTTLDGVIDTLALTDMSVINQAADLTIFQNDLKAALQLLVNAGTDDLNAFDANYHELKKIYDDVKLETDPAAQTTKLLQEILPELVDKLKVNALKLGLAGITKADADTVDALTKVETLQAVGDNTKNVLYDFLQLEQVLPFDNKKISFYLDAPATDDYLIYVKAPQNTEVTLTVNGLDIIKAAVVDKSGEVKNAVELNLTAGKLNTAQLVLANLPFGEKAGLSWRTKGMAKTVIPATNLYAEQSVANAKTSLIRLQKAASLTRLLKLTPRELTYFASENAETKDILNQINTDGSVSNVGLHNIWNKLALLVYFIGLRKDTEEDENTWVQVLENPAAVNSQGKSILLSINYWKQTDLDDVLTKLGFAQTDLSQISKLQKVVTAMNLVTTINYPAASVIAWSTDSPTTALIQQIKDAIRAANDDAAWLDTMQTVSDALRNKQRDALVSYVLFHNKPSAEVNTADKLYEYFLIDVQMDACMKTSRIRQALSTVQLFIQRCLMNLEPDVAPASIRAQQWQWMSRYRVWEANRKVFLYPENWLEPELRDDKSSMFRELEGELLQSDINDDLAEEAFLNYLKKLDDIARLEIVGMYLEENEKGNQDDDILHVFGRTNGSTRQYYYRRYEYGYWTPWEKITLNVSGEHIFPIVWKKRLFVFWLTFVQKANNNVPNETVKQLSDLPWSSRMTIDVEITMNWGEYYKGKWTSPKSADLSRPILMKGLSSFNPTGVLLYARKEKKSNSSEHLIFNLYNTSGNSFQYFTITYTSKNCAPKIDNTFDADLVNKVAAFNYTLYRSGVSNPADSILFYNSILQESHDLNLEIEQPANAYNTMKNEKLLTKSADMFNEYRLLPLRHIIENQWEAPFFYDDEQNTFFVTQDEQVVADIRFYDGYYNLQFDPNLKVDIPILVEQTIPGWPPKGDGILNRGDVVSDPWEFNATVIDQNQNYTHMAANQSLFNYSNVSFSTGGKLPDGVKTVVDQSGFKI